MTNLILTYHEPILVILLITLLFAFAGITTYNIIDYFFRKENDDEETF